MVLHLIGVGLGEAEDLTVHGLNLINTCSKLYLLASKYHPFDKEHLAAYLSKELTVITPDEFQEKIPHIAKESLGEATQEGIGILMPGNPFCDNFYPLIKFHCDTLKVPLKIVHNASYLNAMGNTGIQLYKFGETVFVDGCIEDDMSHYFEVMNSNMEKSLNTLVIFDKTATSNLSLEFLTALSNLKVEGKETSANANIVLLHKKDGDRKFTYGSSSTLLEDFKCKEVEALGVCAEFDCVEDEYLKEMSAYHSGLKGEERKGKGNFNVVGLGLGKPEDITLRGRRLIEGSGKVFLEGYTSIMLGGKEELEAFFKKKIIVADREMVEQNSDAILNHLESDDVSFLVVGDPFGATTHTDIILRALKVAKEIVISNNASIINALGLSGLKPRKFGGIISIPFWTDNYKPDSFYDKISANTKKGWHTLCLLDIQVKEQSFENLARGRKIYEKPRYMSSSVAAKQLLEAKEKRLQDCLDVHTTEETKTISLTRVGTQTESVPHFPLGDLPEADLGPPLHSLVIVGEVDEEERKAIA